MKIYPLTQFSFKNTKNKCKFILLYLFYVFIVNRFPFLLDFFLEVKFLRFVLKINFLLY